MKNVKKDKGVIAIDFDGTLIQEGFYVSDADLAALQEASEAGYLIVISTGRGAALVATRLADLCLEGIVDVILGCNGVEYLDVSKGMEIETLGWISKAVIEEVLDILAGREFAFAYNSEGKLFSTRNNPRAQSFASEGRTPLVYIDNDKIIETFPDKAPKAVIILVSEQDICLRDLLLTSQPKEYDMMFSDTDMFEIVPKGLNKGSGLMEVCRRYDIALKDCLAIGDQENDQAMLAISGFSVAMGNAVEELKISADYVTSSLENNGVAEAVTLFLIKQRLEKIEAQIIY